VGRKTRSRFICPGLFQPSCLLHLSRTNFTKWNGLCDCGEYVSVESVCGGRLGGREKKAKLKKEGVGMRGKEKVGGHTHTHPPTPM